MRVAIIGSGAAAAGVWLGLRSLAEDAEIHVFEAGEAPPSLPAFASEEDPVRARKAYDAIYRRLKQKRGLHFPPVKTQFGEGTPRVEVGGKKRFFISRQRGGLTNFWGATLLPFAGDDWRDWPFDPTRLAPWYARVADMVGISGGADALEKTYGRTYSNRPPIALPAALQRLRDHLSARDVPAGVNRVALETRPGLARSCTGCGQCMVGCYRESLYHSRLSLESDPSLHWHFGEVRHVRTGGVALADGSEHGGWDAIFLCAGCPGSTAIALRSGWVTEAHGLQDNVIYQFPLLRTSWRCGGDPARSLALSNLVLHLEGDPHPAQVQIYPSFDTLFRSALPEALWPPVGAAVSRLRYHLLWGRLYLHAEESHRYRMALDGQGEASYTLTHRPDPAAARPFLRRLDHALRGSGYVRVPVRPIPTATSSHLAGTLPYGRSVPPSGLIHPGVWVCDSSVFPHTPATSLTFTLMANAARTAYEAFAPRPLPHL